MSEPHNSGMTLRQYYAARAMQGDWAAQDMDSGFYENDHKQETMIERAKLFFRMADAMLQAESEVV